MQQQRADIDPNTRVYLTPKAMFVALLITTSKDLSFEKALAIADLRFTQDGMAPRNIKRGEVMHSSLPTADRLKRQDRWSAFTKPICDECIAHGHITNYRVRYAVGMAADERCACPCHVEAKAA